MICSICVLSSDYNCDLLRMQDYAMNVCIENNLHCSLIQSSDDIGYEVSLLSPAGAVGPGTGDIATSPVRLSVRHI